jgi:propionyl-CoA synthetase
VIAVGQLPKTRSGKVLRAAIRKLADGETIDTPPTIENPQSLDLIVAALAERDRRTATANTLTA